MNSKDIVENLKDIYYKQATECLNSNGKLEVYREVKKQHRLEPYLTSNLKTEWKKSITKMRLSAHHLPIEAGRKFNIPRVDRKCNLCDSGDIGDEFHFLFACSHEHILATRLKLEHQIRKINVGYSTLNEHDKFTYLMSMADKDTWQLLGVALSKLLKVIPL